MDSLTRSSKSFSRGSHLHCTEADEPTIILTIATCTETMRTDANRGCPLMMRWSLSDFEGIFDFWEQRSEFPRKVEIQETQLPQFRSWYVVSFKVNFQSTEYKLPTGGLVWKNPDFFEPCDRNELACSERALATYETCKNKQAGYNSVIWNVTQEIAVVSWGKTRIARFFCRSFSKRFWEAVFGSDLQF